MKTQEGLIVSFGSFRRHIDMNVTCSAKKSNKINLKEKKLGFSWFRKEEI